MCFLAYTFVQAFIITSDRIGYRNFAQNRICSTLTGTNCKVMCRHLVHELVLSCNVIITIPAIHVVEADGLARILTILWAPVASEVNNQLSKLHAYSLYGVAINSSFCWLFVIFLQFLRSVVC